MSRTILYYPEIQIPTSGTWIRKSLLYWDKLGAIVPRSYDDRMDAKMLKRYSPEIECLYKEGIFKPFNPEILLRKPDSREALTFELKQTLLPKQPKKSRTIVIAQRCEVPIYRDKVAHEVFAALRERGLAVISPNDHSVYLFESTTAHVYMALFAKHLAQHALEPTVPSSDSAAEIDMMFGGDPGKASENLILSSRFSEVIPAPAPDVPLRKILRFKKKHEAELLSFYEAIDQFQKGIGQCTTTKELKALLQSQKDQIRKETTKLSKALKANTIGSWLGTLQSFIKPTSPTLWGAGLVIAGKAVSLAAVPIPLVLAGAGITASIDVGVHWFNKVQERKAAIGNSAFAYLFLANKKLG